MRKDVLDKGFVVLVDSMGTDASILEAARVSYQKGGKSSDRDLMRYMFRSWHTSPFEQCLAGSTLIPTMPCKGATRKSVSIKEITDAFNRNYTWVKQLKIRTVNKEGVLEATHVKSAKFMGTKKVYKVTTKGPLPRTITATDNHPFLCPNAEYKKVSDLEVGSEVMLNGFAVLSNKDIASMWDSGLKLEEISTMSGLARSKVYRTLKEMSVNTSKRVDTKDSNDLLYPHAKSRIHLKDKCEVCGYPGQNVHHLDGNESNNNLDNLLTTCTICHKAFHNDPFQLRVYVGIIETITEAGIEDVYDLEVESQNHNFVADGFVVHNCELQFHVKLPIFVVRQWHRHRTWMYSEISGRYSEMKDEMYIPETLRLQSRTNKQGSETGFVDSHLHLSNMQANYDDVFEEYNIQLELGVAKELARITLPLSLYTEMYAKVNLHNLMHFLALRMDNHAQYEIRVYAEAIYELVKNLFPLAIEAFDDYHPLRSGMSLSKGEVMALHLLLKGDTNVQASSNKREQGEWEEKLKRILCDTP